MWRLAPLPLLVALLLSGCGDAGDDATTSPTVQGRTEPVSAGPAPAPAELVGRSFQADKLRGRRPVAGSVVGISFRARQLAVQTGCNGISGGWTVEEDRLRTNDLVQTMIGCEPRVTRQEAWLSSFLQSSPRIALVGRRLTLTRDDGSTARFVEREADSGPPPIAGTRWTLETIADAGPDGTASSVPAGVRAPTLRITSAGRAELFAGCNSGGGRATVRDDGFVVFGPIALTRMACDADAMKVEAAVTAVLDGSVAAGFEGDRLSLAKAGRRLVFRAG
jgi:heat shock protein HslJ